MALAPTLPAASGRPPAWDFVRGAGKVVINAVTGLHQFPARHRGQWHSYQGDVTDARGKWELAGADVLTGALQTVGVVGRPENREATRDRRPLLARTELYVPTDEAVGALHFRATAKGNDWGVAGRESTAVSVYIDGGYHADVPILAERRETYGVNLGALSAGTHNIEIRSAHDTARKHAQPAVVSEVTTKLLTGQPAVLARHAPILEGRDLGFPGGPAETGYDDVPLLLVPTVSQARTGARTVQYRVLFSNENGGTETSKLYRTRGRATDYEPLYRVKLDPQGRRVAAAYQGPRHTNREFEGEYLDDQPLLRTATSNNNFSQRVRDRSVRWAPLPEPAVTGKRRSVDLMAAHPWTFTVMAKELLREGRAVPEGPRKPSQIADPRTYLYLPGDADPIQRELEQGRTIHLRTTDGRTLPMTMAQPERISRDDGAALPLPPQAVGDAIAGVVGLSGRAFVLGADLVPRRLASGLT